MDGHTGGPARRGGKQAGSSPRHGEGWASPGVTPPGGGSVGLLQGPRGWVPRSQGPTAERLAIHVSSAKTAVQHRPLCSRCPSIAYRITFSHLRKGGGRRFPSSPQVGTRREQLNRFRWLRPACLPRGRRVTKGPGEHLRSKTRWNSLGPHGPVCMPQCRHCGVTRAPAHTARPH